jgi:type II secretory pathway predicted ATPase ExeA
VNPYDPQRPASPDTFAGREGLIRAANDFVGRALSRRRSSAILVHGHRGSGKTSALRKIQSVAQDRAPESVVIEIPLRQSSSDTVLLGEIVEEIRRCVRTRAEQNSAYKRMLARIESLGVSVLGTGVEVARSREPPLESALSRWRDVIGSIEGVPLICVCVDDAELLDAPGLGTLKTLSESVSATPILLAVAGGPDLWSRVSERGFSPVARVFSGAVFDMESFRIDETEEALNGPIRITGATGSWERDGVEEVQRLSHGYPYLVQCLAHASYADDRRIRRNHVVDNITSAVATAGPWLRHEIPRASDVDIRTFVKLAQTGRTNFRSSEIIELGVQSPYIGRLVKLGVLQKVARGHYDLKKAPVIAYYHALQRNLNV